jgi:ABC-2 type transport system permease protein
VTVVLAATGIGYMVGSLVFLFRKIDALRMVLQFALLFAVMIPVETWSGTALLAGSFLPVAPSAAALRLMLVSEQVSWALCGLGLLNGIVYLAVGIVIFKRAQRYAQQKGTIAAF